MFSKIRAWFRAIVQDVVNDERKITSIIVGSVHNDISRVEFRLENLKAEILAELKKV
jgi:hypothetical protein